LGWSSWSGTTNPNHHHFKESIMYRRSHISPHEIKRFLLANRNGLKKVALAIGAASAFIMAVAFCALEKIFAHPFHETPLMPGAFEAWCVAQVFGKVFEFFKREADENIHLMHNLP
jgi:hypothetical protein